MKYMLILCAALLLTGCASERIEQIVEPSYVTEPHDEVLTISTEETINRVGTSAETAELLKPLIAPMDTDFVRVRDYIPELYTELKYSTDDNFTGQVIYTFEDAFLRYGTVMKLKAVSDELKEMGLYLKIWDGFRPVSAQFRLWEICPDDTYVANPNKGYSNHSRGFAVDITLVDEQGREVEMPTGFDDFSARADRDYSDCSQLQKENALLLEHVMEKHGFSGYWGEWWHFNDTQKYEVETCFDPSVISSHIVSEKAALLEDYRFPDREILAIPEGDCVTLLGYQDNYALVEYWGYRGYIPAELIMK